MFLDLKGISFAECGLDLKDIFCVAGSRENRNVYLSDIPECVSRDPLYVVFPSAYIIQEPREG